MFEFIPAIDVLGGSVVRLERGDYDAVTVYQSDPVVVAREFVAAGVPIVHVVDLEGARSGAPDRALRCSLADAGIPFQIGGGLRTTEAAVAAIEGGATRVVAGTAAVWDPAELRRMIAAVGTARFVAAVDVADGRAKGGGWMDEGQPLEAVLENLVNAGVTRVLATAIARDGMMNGPDLDLLAAVAASGLSVIASGGVGTLADLEAVVAAGASGAIVGKAIYEGRFTVAEALAAIG